MSERSYRISAPTDLDAAHLSQLLTVLHEVSFRLSTSKSVDELCREAVLRARKQLEFDRIGIWFFDPLDKGFLCGTYGVDETGNLRDERSSRVAVDRELLPSHFFEDKVPYLLFRNRAVFDEEHRKVGVADLAVAPIWNGHTSMGTVSADTFLKGTPLDEAHCHILALLARSIGHLATLIETEQRLRESQGRLEILASRDGLTGALNRRTGLELLEQQMSHNRRFGGTLSICFIDLDGLKRVNDTKGHQIGDRYIQLVNALFEKTLRESDVVCRMGGDEFMIILPGSGADEAEAVLARVTVLAQGSRELVEIKDPPYFSYGIAEQDAETLRGDELIHRADERMYTQKRGHRGDSGVSPIQHT